MPTRKDKTNVTPIYREQVFIPASGATLLKQKARPKVAGRPVASGTVEIVSPEFDLLTGVRGFANMVKPKNYKSIISSDYCNPAISELDNFVNQGIAMGRDYFNHPIVKNTLEHNRQLYRRIIGKPQNMIYIDKNGNKVLAKERGELLNNAVSKPINYKFDKLPKGEAGTYNRNADMSGNITIAEGLAPTITKNSAFHETLHHGAYGNYDGIIYDLKAEKLFPNNAYLRAGHEAAANTAEVGRDMGLAIGQKYPGMTAFKNILDNLPKPYYKDVVIKNAKLETPRDYKRFWDALTGKYFTTTGVTVTGLNLNNTDEMKCGGRHKAQLGLDIQYGGRAIPITKNMVYFDGNSHSAGGIGVGNNLEVEGGEVGEKKGNSLRIFSAVPFLDGISPAQLVMGGANPNKVFKAQEDFKDRNRINDDGTTYKKGGMIYTVNGNVKNGLMSARPKAVLGTIKRHGKTWKWNEEYGAYVPVKDSKEKESINVNKQTKSSISSNKKPNYTINGTFDNARPQYYAEKRLPIAGSQSIAEKAGLARSGWSYADNPTLDYVPNIDLSIPDNYGKGSTPRRGETKATSSKAAGKSSPILQDTINQITRDAISRSITPKIDLSKVQMPKFDVSQLGSKETKDAKAKLNTPPTGSSIEPKDGRWVPQFKPINTGDWIGLGSNLAGHIASYITNNALLKRFPMPTKPIMAPAAKLKTRYNINPELSENRETELVNRSAVRRNSQSSNTSLAREQRIVNEARNARNKLYGQKENIETQLINQDRLNRQTIAGRNVAAYNDWLDKTYVAKSNRMLAKQQNLMSLINGIPTAVNNIIGNIESRRNTNNTIKVIAAANPNVDGRLLGIGDYYSQRLSDGRVAIYDKNGKLKRIK